MNQDNIFICYFKSFLFILTHEYKVLLLFTFADQVSSHHVWLSFKSYNFQKKNPFKVHEDLETNLFFQN